MSNKFKVGDLVKPVEDLSLYGFPLDEVVPVVNIYGNQSTIRVRNVAGLEETFFVERFELVSRKQTGSQRLAKLEETVAKQGEEIVELKNFLKTALAIKSPSEYFATTPSTGDAVEDVIEFEGQRYKKVNRMLREGDVVICKNQTNTDETPIEDNQPYLVGQRDWFKNHSFKVYSQYHNRTTETVDVYELIVDDKSKIRGITIEIDAPKSANQLRAEVIEKAKMFLEKKKVTRYQNGNRYEVYINRKTLNWVNADFIVNAEKRTVVCLVRWTKDKSLDGRGIAKCRPTDVFNEHIGKAIALGRALGLDVSEFENAVQPNKAVEGALVKVNNSILEVTDRKYVFGKTCHVNSNYGKKSPIYNDTNAEYEVNA